jgi:hypothetical protein
MTFDEKINCIPWEDFCTAYGRATDVPDQLRRLASPDQKTARAASHDLWCGLCHQRVQVGSAALPALPFLLEVLDSASPDLTFRLLDIFWGFAIGTNRRRLLDYQKFGFFGNPKTEQPKEAQWSADLRNLLISELPKFESYTASPDEDISSIASEVVAELRDSQLTAT